MRCCRHHLGSLSCCCCCCYLLQTSTEVFFRKARFWDGEGRDAPPAFHADGVQYLHVKVGVAGERGVRGGLANQLDSLDPRCCSLLFHHPLCRCPLLPSPPPPPYHTHTHLSPHRWADCTGWPAPARMCRPPWCWSCSCASTGSAGTTLALSARRCARSLEGAGGGGGRGGRGRVLQGHRAAPQ